MICIMMYSFSSLASASALPFRRSHRGGLLATLKIWGFGLMGTLDSNCRCLAYQRGCNCDSVWRDWPGSESPKGWMSHVVDDTRWMTLPVRVYFFPTCQTHTQGHRIFFP